MAARSTSLISGSRDDTLSCLRLSRTRNSPAPQLNDCRRYGNNEIRVITRVNELEWGGRVAIVSSQTPLLDASMWSSSPGDPLPARHMGIYKVSITGIPIGSIATAFASVVRHAALGELGDQVRDAVLLLGDGSVPALVGRTQAARGLAHRARARALDAALLRVGALHLGLLGRWGARKRVISRSS